MTMLIAAVNDEMYFSNESKKLSHMRKLVLLVLVLSFWGGMAQQMTFDYIAPFHDGKAAVQKGNEWGFINDKGELIVSFRSDLVPTEKDGVRTYPRFDSGRALIGRDIEGIPHYGYIDMMGSVVVDPVFINASVFRNGHAIALKVNKQTLGRNEVLGKDVVSYSYNEVVIDVDGEMVAFLRGPVHLQYDKEFLKENPAVMSYFLNDGLVATQREDATWELHSLKDGM